MTALSTHCRKKTLWNTLLFVIILYFFNALIENIFMQLPITVLQGLSHYLFQNFSINFLTLMTLLSIYLNRSISKFFLAAYLTCFFLNNIYYSIENFNKLALLLTFSQAILGIFCFMNWSNETKSASFCPNFRPAELNTHQKFLVDVKISKKNDQEKIPGVLTNYSAKECFIKLSQNRDDLIKQGQLNLEFCFRGTQIPCKGKILTSLGNIGLGLEILEENDKTKTQKSWPKFYGFLRNSGL